MNVFAKFGEIPSMILQDIKETKRFGHTFVRSFGRTDGRMDNVKGGGGGGGGGGIIMWYNKLPF